MIARPELAVDAECVPAPLWAVLALPPMALVPVLRLVALALPPALVLERPLAPLPPLELVPFRVPAHLALQQMLPIALVLAHLSQVPNQSVLCIRHCEQRLLFCSDT